MPSPPAAWSPPTPLPTRIETDRLVLRWFEETDARALFEAVVGSRDTLLPWMPWAAGTHASPEESLATIRSFADQRVTQREYSMGVFDRGGGLLGAVGLHRIACDTHSGEVGYWLAARARGHGFCTEAARHLISAALRPQDAGGFGLRRIEIICSAENAPSARVADRIGLPRVARLRRNRWVDGYGWTDSLVWDVLADEWDTRRHALRA